MNVETMIRKLQQFDPSLEVTICDGWNGVVYAGRPGWDFQFSTFRESGDSPLVLDIGIGGCETKD